MPEAAVINELMEMGEKNVEMLYTKAHGLQRAQNLQKTCNKIDMIPSKVRETVISFRRVHNQFFQLFQKVFRLIS